MNGKVFIAAILSLCSLPLVSAGADPDLMPLTLTWTGDAVAGETLTVVGTVTTNGNQIVWTIDALPNGVNAQLTITVVAVEEGDFTHVINVGGSGIVAHFDPVLTIAPPQLGVRSAGGAVEVFWPSVATSYTPHSTPTLLTPDWSPAKNPVLIVGDERHVPWTGTNQTMFFRLQRS